MTPREFSQQSQSPFSRWRARSSACLSLLMLLLMLGGCAMARNSRLQEDFEQKMKGYNKMLRWHEVENAGMLYLQPKLRDEFMKTAEEIKKRGVTITDYRIVTFSCRPEQRSADVVVEFDYYALPSNRIKTITYRQKWEYDPADGGEAWQLTTPLPKFE